MEVFSRRAEAESAPARDRVRLTWERRQKSRQRVTLESGETVALMLPRGTVLRGGERLVSDTGRVIEVIAEEEPVSTLRSSDAARLARVAYHLGNRHTPLQVGSGWLRYRADHVLDAMVAGLGVRPETGRAPFEPEAGAWSHGHGAHSTQGGAGPGEHET